MRKLSLMIAAAALLFSIAGAAFMIEALYRAPGARRGATVRFKVASGEPFSAVAAGLARDGLIRHPRLLNLYAVLNGCDRLIDAGTYECTIGDAPTDILKKLVAGDVVKIAVTIPEGQNMWEIAGAVSAHAGVDSSAFVACAGDPITAAGFGIRAPSLEGFLFPETYLIPWGLGIEEIVEMMVSKYGTVFDACCRAAAESTGMSMVEAVTLASIIEAEARLPEERALISAVYHNRLKRHMKLEADPTLAYAMGGYRGRLFYNNLLVDSPYNTYVYEGLPPGPICNPGRASIEAALRPDPGCRALYFVAKGDGGHIFSETLEEHRAAVQAARK
ncbi:MAG: endolytic transglycosylase MltG [Chitinivibrionia bacterium]|nr:endolytic transglycosylase MltG [Chitinivibrionia bacterium]